MIGLLVKKEFLPINIQPQKIRFPEKLPYIKNWGIHTKTGMIGYLKTEIRFQPTGYLWKNEAEIRLLPDMPLSINSSAVFNKDERLEDFHIFLTYEDLAIDLTGVIREDVLRLLVKTNEGENEYTMPWYIESDIMSNGIIPWFYVSGLKIGDKFHWHILNPLTQTKDLVKAVVKRSSFYYNKNDFVPTMVVDMYYQDIKIEFWIDNKGNPLKVITPWGWELTEQ